MEGLGTFLIKNYSLKIKHYTLKIPSQPAEALAKEGKGEGGKPKTWNRIAMAAMLTLC
jgi:hypothetical protein